MKFNLIKHDEALKDLAGQLKEFWSAWTIEQRAVDGALTLVKQHMI